MLKVTYDPVDPTTGWVCPEALIAYDGGRFSLIHLDDDVWQVMVERRGKWYYFGNGLYHSFVEATEAIFYDVMLERFESGRFFYDEEGNVIDSISLTYYDKAA